MSVRSMQYLLQDDKLGAGSWGEPRTEAQAGTLGDLGLAWGLGVEWESAVGGLDSTWA